MRAETGGINVDVAEGRQIGSDFRRIRMQTRSYYRRHARAFDGSGFAGTGDAEVKIHFGVLTWKQE